MGMNGEREHSVFNSHQISKNWKVHRHGLLTRKPENPYGKSLFSSIRTVEMKGSSKLYCFNRYTQGNANFCSNYCYHTDSLFRSLKIISSLLKIERHHPQRDWGISSDGSFFIIHHFQFMSFAFFPSLHSVEKKID